MKKTTKLMSKLFSDSTPNQFKEDVMDKIEEAKQNGSSEYSDETSDLKMESDGEEVKITDAKNGDEVTVATENPDVEGDVQLKAESDTAPDVQTPVTKGIDGEHIEDSVPDVEVKVDMGITDEGKAGLKAYSIKFFGNKSFSDTLKTARAIAKAFSECPVAATRESIERSANAALDNAEPSEEEKEFAEQVDQIAQNATELAKAADDMEETQDPALAKTVKEMSEDLEEQCNDLKNEHPDNCDFSNIIAQCKKFSDAANEIVAKTDATTEAPTESPTESATEKPTEAATEAPTEAPTEAATEAPTEEPKDDPEAKKAAENVADKAKKVQEKAESLSDDDVEGAEELKEMCNDLKSDIEDAEENHDNVQIDDEVKEKIESYSTKADTIINSQVRNFSQSSYMSNGNFIPTPKVKTTGTQRTFSNANDTKKVQNPYLFSKF